MLAHRASLLVLLTVIVSPAWATNQQEAMCENSAVLMCDNYAARALGNASLAAATFKNQGWATSGTSLVVVNTQSPDAGGHSLQFTHPANPNPDPDQSGGAGFTDTSWTPAGRDVYVRWYTKWCDVTPGTCPSGFTLSPIATKQMALGNTSTGYSTTHFGIMFFGGRQSVINNQDTGVIYQQNLSPVSYQNGQWYCNEAHILSSSAPNVADGAYEMWIDGVRHWNYPNIVTHTTGPNYVNAMQPTGAGFSGPNPAQQRWMGAIIVSTARIGCLGGLGAPGSLTISAR